MEDKSTIHTDDTPNYTPEDYDTLVIYHGWCPDGVAAASVFQEIPGFDKTWYHGTNERVFANDKRMPSVYGKRVFIVDYSYPREVLEQLAKLAKSITVFDHHVTAQQDLAEPIENVTCVFDMARCGAEITWDEMTKKTPRPWWMNHIRDRDLWDWKHNGSAAFAAAFNDFGITFKTINIVKSLNSVQRAAFIARGQSILDLQERITDKICNNATLAEFEGYTVYVVNSPIYQSEVGNILATRPDCSFALVYRYNHYGDEWYISLRGVKEKGIDLSKLAKKYGGGGHALACGFSYIGSIRNIIGNITPR